MECLPTGLAKAEIGSYVRGSVSEQCISIYTGTSMEQWSENPSRRRTQSDSVLVLCDQFCSLTDACCLFNCRSNVEPTGFDKAFTRP